MIHQSRLIPGFQVVRESLLSEEMAIQEIWITQGEKGPRVTEIVQIAERRHIPVRFKMVSEVSRVLPDNIHQGFIALVEGFHYADLDQIVGRALKVQGKGLLIAVDHITDEGNLGALIRTAAFFGSHGMVIPKDRSAGVTARVLKSAAGAHNYLPVAKVVNLGMTLKFLDKKGFWIIGTSVDEGVLSLYEFDWKRDVVLVLGNEQKGVSPSVRRLCHQVIGIPVTGQVDALNVSVAGGVILSEIKRQRAN
jgi:23S rRNA (guanosine2251-2'-O)-methyltransferase